MPRGKYIVIEGNDGTGKSTQVELLNGYLKQKGIASVMLHEPGGTPIADAIRTVLKNGELERDAETNLLLFTAARRENWRWARAKLEFGTWVLSARNYLSTEVYQGHAEGLDRALIRRQTREFTDELYMSPDLTVVLAVSDDVRKQRITTRGALTVKDTFESRGEDFQAAINAGYAQVAAEYGYPTIDANRSIDEIQADIRKLIDL